MGNQKNRNKLNIYQGVTENNMNKTLKWIIGLVVVVILVWIGIATSKNKTENTEQADGPIKIGFSLPLTGDIASFGESARAGAELAIDDINTTGGINGRQIIPVFEDDQCVSRMGATVFNKLTGVDKVDAIVGPLCSSIAGGSLPIAEQSETPTLFWASAPGLPELGEHLFRSWPSDTFAGRRSAEFIYNDLEKRKVAVLHINDDWGVGLRNVFTEVFKELGGTIVFEDGVLANDTDLKTTLSKVKATNPEALYMPVYPANAVAAFQDIRELNIDIPVVDGEGFEDPSVLELPQAEGAFINIAKWDNPEEFKARVFEHTGVDPNFMAALAYDAVHLLASVINEYGTDSDALVEGLSKVSYTEGVSIPLIEFDENGDLKSAVYETKVIQNGESVPYKK